MRRLVRGTYPFKFRPSVSCERSVLQSSWLSGEQQSSHQADYSLSINLAALFVPADYAAWALIPFLFAALSFTLTEITVRHRTRDFEKRLRLPYIYIKNVPKTPPSLTLLHVQRATLNAMHC